MSTKLYICRVTDIRFSLISLYINRTLSTSPTVNGDKISLVQSHTAGIVGDRRRPVGEDTTHADLLRERINNTIHVAILANSRSERLNIVVFFGSSLRQGREPLKGPGDDVETGFLGGHGILGGHKLAILGRVQQCIDRGSHDLDALLGKLGQAGNSSFVTLFGVGAFVEVNGLLAERRFMLDPVEDVLIKEGLGPHAGWADVMALVIVDELLSVHLLGVVTLERHGNLRGLQLGRELQAQGLDQLNVLMVCHGGATGVIELCAPGWSAILVFLRGCGRRVAGIHLGAERLELSQCDIGCAALGLGWRAVCRRLEGNSALSGQLRDGQDVGGCVEITLRVTANELSVLGEGDVALDDASTHASSGHHTLATVLRDLQRATPMGDGKLGSMTNGRLCAGLQLAFQGTLIHVIHEEIRPGTDLDVGHIGLMRGSTTTTERWSSSHHAGGHYQGSKMHDGNPASVTEIV